MAASGIFIPAHLCRLAPHCARYSREPRASEEKMCIICKRAPLCVPGWGFEPHSVSGFQSVEVVNLRLSVLRARHLHVSPAGCPLLFSRTAQGGVLSCIHLSGEEWRGVEPLSVGDALQIAPVCFPHTPLPFPVSGFLVRPQAVCLHNSLPCNFWDYHFHAATLHRHLTDLACENAVFAVCKGVAYVLVCASENFRDSSVFAVLNYDFFLHILAFLYF